jgi:site-specific DNA-methyltransferase (adenine-specific)/modification methylase
MGIVKEERIGGQTLYLGDCLQVMPLLGRFDAVVTDPPYGVLSQSGSAATRRSGGNTNNGVCKWDVSITEDAVSAIIGAGNDAMIWGGCHMALPATFGYLIWDKVCEGLNFGEVEYCWTTKRFAPRMIRLRAAGMDGGKQHPTQKPVALMEWCLGFLPDARTILDPFMGSGTTLVACQRLGRQGTGIELDPEYFAIACKRVDEATRQPDLFIAPAPPKPTQEQLI